ncbi:hypothetical protein ACT6QE_09615, partial [Staphylococcus aureus]
VMFMIYWFSCSQIVVFNRVLCPSYQGFRIYRETLSRFWCAASMMVRRLMIWSMCLTLITQEIMIS